MLARAFLNATTLAAVAATMAACYVDVSTSESGRRGGGSTSTGTATGGTGGGSAASPPASTETLPTGKPMLVLVDTGKTMGATPGEGVGVFVEYAQGGKWHVWWTCDTTHTSQTCAFRVKASLESGAIASSRSEGFGTADVFTRVDTTRVEATTTTGAGANGLWIETAPGAVLTVEAQVTGVTETGFLFFVQDGQVNGGYAGRLTNPLMFQGKTP